MNDLARLVAIEDIKQLKARYYRFLDTHDWEGFRSLWTPDAVMDMNFPDRILTGEDGIYRGPDAITAFPYCSVRQTDRVEVILIGFDAGAVNLHLNNAGVDAIHRRTESLIKHRGACVVDLLRFMADAHTKARSGSTEHIRRSAHRAVIDVTDFSL